MGETEVKYLKDARTFLDKYFIIEFLTVVRHNLILAQWRVQTFKLQRCSGESEGKMTCKYDHMTV
jgi:hypothetical protein